MRLVSLQVSIGNANALKAEFLRPHLNIVGKLLKVWMTIVCGGYQPPEGTRDFLRREGINPDATR